LLDFTAQIPLTLNSVLKSYQAESTAHINNNSHAELLKKK